jgi:hypothetical protein
LFPGEKISRKRKEARENVTYIFCFGESKGKNIKGMAGTPCVLNILFIDNRKPGAGSRPGLRNVPEGAPCPKGPDPDPVLSGRSAGSRRARTTPAALEIPK